LIYFCQPRIPEFIPSDKIEIALPLVRNDKRGTCLQRQQKGFLKNNNLENILSYTGAGSYPSEAAFCKNLLKHELKKKPREARRA
jgi:hypothetical protein